MEKFDVNKLRIASPCPMNWENMSGDEKVRFCQSCKLNVYNVSEMTNAEVTSLIAKTEGRICGRIYRRSDGTILTKDCPVGIRLQIKRVSKFAGAVFASIIGLFSVAFSQTDNKDKKDESCKIISQGKVIREKSKTELISIKGTVTDLNGALIPSAKVIFVNTETEKEFSTKADKDGEFKLKELPNGNYEAKFSYEGFKDYKVAKLQLNKNENLNFEVSLKPDGEVVVGVMIGNEDLIDVTSSSTTFKISGDMIRRLPF